MSTITNKEALLAVFKPKIIKVPLPGDGGSVLVRALTVAQVDAVRAEIKKEEAAKTAGVEEEKDSFGLRLMLLSVIDEDGKRLFSDADLPALKGSGNGPVEHLILEVMKLNGFHKAPAEKNSVMTQKADSVAA